MYFLGHFWPCDFSNVTHVPSTLGKKHIWAFYLEILFSFQVIKILFQSVVVQLESTLIPCAANSVCLQRIEFVIKIQRIRPLVLPIYTVLNSDCVTGRVRLVRAQTWVHIGLVITLIQSAFLTTEMMKPASLRRKKKPLWLCHLENMDFMMWVRESLPSFDALVILRSHTEFVFTYKPRKSSSDMRQKQMRRRLKCRRSDSATVT